MPAPVVNRKVQPEGVPKAPQALPLGSWEDVQVAEHSWLQGELDVQELEPTSVAPTVTPDASKRRWDPPVLAVCVTCALMKRCLLAQSSHEAETTAVSAFQLRAFSRSATHRPRMALSVSTLRHPSSVLNCWGTASSSILESPAWTMQRTFRSGHPTNSPEVEPKSRVMARTAPTTTHHVTAEKMARLGAPLSCVLTWTKLVGGSMA
mmetsp:Transcript_88884/g.154161  ORF Transcript_88884/g.154161 Transcript_88884/m.154161 type:complete len:207 (+) Transcript_88884:7870-8490(+)